MNKAADYVLFGIQVALLVLFVWLPKGLTEPLRDLLQWIGTAMIALGLIIVLWGIIQLRQQLSPLPSPRSSAKLIKSGIYAVIRHPIYSGILFAAFGLAIYEVNPIRLVFALALMIFFTIKAGYEERRLMEVFRDYDDYKLRTGRFFPDWSAGAVDRAREEEKEEEAESYDNPAAESDDQPTEPG
jgi:protein-S-isoprenylcysteine O-methyltransferase Ste14